MLKWSLAAGATVVLGGALTSGVGVAWLPEAAEGRRMLSATEIGIVAAIGAALFPAGNFPIDGTDEGFLAEVDRILDDGITPLGARGVRYVLRALEWGTFASRGVRFTDLSIEERQEVLDAWASPDVYPRRVAMSGLRSVLSFAFFSRRPVLEQIGWRNACSGGLA